MTDVFISYASEDRESAFKVASALEARGCSVWWDRKIKAGQTFDQVIERELETAKSVVVLWSARSISSEWVKNEAAVAAQRGVLVPVLIDSVKPPLEFRRKQTADLVGWDGSSSHPGFQALCDALAGPASSAGSVSHQAVSQSDPRFRWDRQWTLRAMAALIVAVGLGAYLGARYSALKVGRADQAERQAQAGSPVSDTQGAQNSGRPASVRAGELAKRSKRVNLFAKENGGHLLTASSDDWQATIDGSEDGSQISWGTGTEAVYAFKDEKQATFDLFTILIMGSNYANVKEFELLSGNDSPTGVFESIGRFQTQNLKLFQTPYQEFKFPPVKARYLKMKLISAYGTHPWVHEFQLFGNLE